MFQSEGLFPPASVSDTAITRLTVGLRFDGSSHRTSPLDYLPPVVHSLLQLLIPASSSTGELLLAIFALVASTLKLQKIGFLARVRHARLVRASLRPPKNSTPPPRRPLHYITNAKRKLSRVGFEASAKKKGTTLEFFGPSVSCLTGGT